MDDRPGLRGVSASLEVPSTGRREESGARDAGAVDFEPEERRGLTPRGVDVATGSDGVLGCGSIAAEDDTPPRVALVFLGMLNRLERN